MLTDNIETRALARSVVEQFQKLVDLSPHLPDELKLAILNIDDVSRLADVVSTMLNLTVPQRQESLETLNVAERLRKVNVHLSRELQTAELSTKIASQVKTEFDKDQREFILRRQLKAIQEELGETDEGAAEWTELRKPHQETPPARGGEQGGAARARPAQEDAAAGERVPRRAHVPRLDHLAAVAQIHDRPAGHRARRRRSSTTTTTTSRRSSSASWNTWRCAS